MTFKKTHNIAPSTSSSVVLDLLLLDLVEQIQWLIEKPGVCASKVRTLKKTDLICLCVGVLVKQHVELADCVCRAHKFLL